MSLKSVLIYTCLVTGLFNFLNAQTIQNKSLSTDQFYRDIKQQLARQGRNTERTIKLPTATDTLQALITYNRTSDTLEYLIGEIKNLDKSSFYLAVSKNDVRGHILLPNTTLAYEYYKNEKGEVVVATTVDDEIICVNYEESTVSQPQQRSEKQQANRIAAVTLNSRPGANGVVLLDFDGEYVNNTLWNEGGVIDARPFANFDDGDITTVWEIVSEDFAPFNINITTDESVFLSYPRNRRMRCIFTPDDDAAEGSGGIAYVNSFSWNDDTPCWVYINWAPNAGEAASHEIGHTLGLSHDGDDEDDYYGGHNGWAPIMGVSYSEEITQWSRGEYANANNIENDIQRIARNVNGLGFMPDDHADQFTSASLIVPEANGDLLAEDNSGLIEQPEDVDMFSFITGGGDVSFQIYPTENWANLDVLAVLYNGSGQVINTYDPNGLAVEINENLGGGEYFLSIEGTGTGNPITGYSDYGSLGPYTITGNIEASGVVQEPYEGSPSVIPGIVELENFDEGGPGVAYQDNDPENLGGVFRDEQVDISGDATDYYLTDLEADEWVEIAVEVQTSSFYRLEALISSSNPDGRFRLEIDRSDVSGSIDVPNTFGLANFETVEDIVELEAGTYTLRFYVEQGGFNIDHLEFTAVTVDCNLDVNGSASIDACGICSGGNTGVNPCVSYVEAETECPGATGYFANNQAGYFFIHADNYAFSFVILPTIKQGTPVKAISILIMSWAHSQSGRMRAKTVSILTL